MDNSTQKEKELLALIQKWKDCPASYTDLLMKHVYPTLHAICREQVKSPCNIKNSSADSLVHEAYLKMRNTQGYSDIASLSAFYALLRNIVVTMMIDKQRQVYAKKRQSDEVNYTVLEEGRVNDFTVDIEKLQSGLDKLKQMEPDAAEALSLRFYNGKNNAQTAYIMNKSIATIDRLMSEGRKILTAIFHGVEITT